MSLIRRNMFVFVILCQCSLMSCDRGDPVVEVPLRPVRYLPVTDNSVVRDRRFSGISKSARESKLSFKVGGTVTSIPVQIGQRLSSGDLIAQLDAATFSLQTQQAQATLLEAQANERNAIASYDRTKGLYANENASLNDLDLARAQAESVRAQVASASKALEIAGLNQSYTRIYADTDCSIVSIDADVNENVSAGHQVASVSCGDQFEVTLDLSGSLIGSVNEQIPVSIEFAAIPNEKFEGLVSEIAVASSGGQAVFPVVIKIVDTHPDLRSGLAADVTFQFDSSMAGRGVVLPVATVMRSPEGTFVFVVVPDGDEGEAIVKRRAVVLGELSQSGVEIQNGLTKGDLVVTAGISVIRDGQRVLIR